MIAGFATTEGTHRFQSRFSKLNDDHFRPALKLRFPSIGLGTYLGNADDQTDGLLEKAVFEVLCRGVNLIDTAIVYRHMRSERAIARALAKLIPSELSREELIISTKGGFLPVDAARPVPPAQMFERRFVTTGLCPPDELVQRCHCLAVPFLADQLDKSRENLGLETIDIYFLHNPECQLAEIGRSHFRERLEAAFSFLERAVSEQKIRYYGVATWSGFRASEDSLDYLSLEEMMELAESAGGPEHHFRVIQLPINPAMPEALVRKNQTLPSVDERVSLLEAAARKSLAVLSSASIGQMRFPLGLSDAEDASFGVLNTEAQRALQVVRSLPGVSTALVGMKQPAHIGENLAVPTVPVMSPAEAQRVIAGGA